MKGRPMQCLFKLHHSSHQITHFGPHKLSAAVATRPRTFQNSLNKAQPIRGYGNHDNPGSSGEHTEVCNLPVHWSDKDQKPRDMMEMFQ